jgi:hypothetical protein
VRRNVKETISTTTQTVDTPTVSVATQTVDTPRVTTTTQIELVFHTVATQTEPILHTSTVPATTQNDPILHTSTVTTSTQAEPMTDTTETQVVLLKAEIQKWKKIVAQFRTGVVPSSVHLRTLKDIREQAARVVVDYEEKLEEEKKKGEK